MMALSRWSVVLVALVVVSMGVQGEVEFPEEDNVLVLGDDNFHEALAAFPFLLVEFYAPWCGHCKELEPEYAQAASNLKEIEFSVRLAKVDATVNTKLANALAIEGFPTLKFFRSGSPIEYEGGRTAEAIVDWLVKKSGPAAKGLDSLEKYTAWREALFSVPEGSAEGPESFQWNVGVLGVFSDLASDEAKLFEKLANADEQAQFAVAELGAVKDELKLEGDANIVVFRDFEEPKMLTYEGEFTDEEIGMFLSVASFPLVQEFDVERSSLFGSRIPGHLFMFISGDTEPVADSLALFTEAASKWKGKLHFVYIDVDAEDDQDDLLEYFGINKEQMPALRLIARHPVADDFVKYSPESEELSTDVIDSFCQEFVDGKLKPTLKSAEVEEGWNTGHVWTLVGSNHDEVTSDQTKNVFVEYYAPWCGHCKALAPIWAQLGEEFEDVENVVIANMDGTANEAAGLSVEGFPTLMFYPANADTSLDYEGARDFESLVSYLVQTGDDIKLSETSAARAELRESKEAATQALNGFFASPDEDTKAAVSAANDVVLEKDTVLAALLAAKEAAKQVHDEL